MISFQSINVSLPAIDQTAITAWVRTVAVSYGRRVGEIAYIFVDDEEILRVNRQFLQHDYFTDIITFDYSEKPRISGDLFISVDSVRENAEFYGTEFTEELHRVIVHGILHLIGYDDHTDEDTAMMRSKENYYLDVRHKLAGGE